MKKPNIILISIDTLRADHLSCYGYYRKTTPNIDNLASEGTIYLNNFSTGVWTPPAHASMLTGLYVSEHGVYGDKRLADSVPTIATVLKGNEYQTSGFVNNSAVGALVGFDKGHDTFVEVWKGIKPKSIIERIIRGGVRRIRKRLGYEDMGADKTNKLFYDWIRNHMDKERPFYAFLHYIEPHNPLDPPYPYKNKYLNKKMFKNTDEPKIKKVANNPLICFVEDLSLNDDEIDILKALYDSEIEYTDSKIGEVVEILKENNLYDDTMVVITSDHGEHLGEHNLWSHAASLYREILHIPLIIKFPEGIEYIKKVDSYTQLVDIFPTVMKIADIPENALNNNSGISLVYNKKNGNLFHDLVFAEWEGRIPYFIEKRLTGPKSSLITSKFVKKMWMVLDSKYKYISSSDGQDELYDLKNDKNELNNLISKNQEVAARMKMKLAEWKSRRTKNISKEQFIIDEEIKRNLEALGYI